MAKRASESKSPALQAEDRFIELMQVTADFVRNCGGLPEARKALADAGQFIDRAGGIPNAEKALGVLENLKEKLGT